MDRYEEWLRGNSFNPVPPPEPLPMAPLFGQPSAAIGPMMPPMGAPMPMMPMGAPPAATDAAPEAAPAAPPAPSPTDSFMQGGWQLPHQITKPANQDMFGTFLNAQGIQNHATPQPQPTPMLGQQQPQAAPPASPLFPQGQGLGQPSQPQMHKPEDARMPRAREATRFNASRFPGSARTQRLLAMARARRR